MDLTRTAYGTWNGGRFMHFGEALSEERFIEAIRHAYDQGIRTFMTADVYGVGEADSALGRALEGFSRDSYCLVGTIGHDFYEGKREGSKGYPRFTNSTLRKPAQYRDYLLAATEKELERCKTDHFDALLLHNPDSTGYTSDIVWKGMEAVKEKGLARRLGVAPGPANGYSLDLILCFERFNGLIDWAMIILNPLEPWPGCYCLEAAKKFNVKLMTRVVDHGGLFHDDVRPGHVLRPGDHRAFRHAGWVEAGYEKINRMRPLAEKHHLTMLQLACLWNLSQPAVECVIPTLIQEVGGGAKSLEAKIAELAALGTDARLKGFRFSDDEYREIMSIGNNKGCMDLKGGNPAHTGEAVADRWGLTAELEAVAKRWGIDPQKDLTCTMANA